MIKETIKISLMLIGAAAVGYAAVKAVSRAAKGVTKYVAFNEMMKRCSIEQDDEGNLFGCININTDDCEGSGERCDESCGKDCEYCHETATEFAEKEDSEEEEPIISVEITCDEPVKEDGEEETSKENGKRKAQNEKPTRSKQGKENK